MNKKLLILLSTGIVLCTGCTSLSAAPEENRHTAASFRTEASLEESSSETVSQEKQMIFIDGKTMISTGRIAVTEDRLPLSAETRRPDGSITQLVPESEHPRQNEQANFDCQGSPYLILSDGAAALELEGQYMLFLADDTVEYEGIYKKKNQVSEDTLEWLDFYYSLTAQERLAVSMIPSEFASEVRTAAIASAVETSSSAQNVSYREALTEEELAETEALAMHYFTEEVPTFEGVDQIYPADSEEPLYHNAGLEGEYMPGNIIIYRVLTVKDRRDGNPFRYISIARSNKSGAWKVINSGY